MNSEDAIAALGALAQADRLAAFRLLMTTGPDGLPSGIIAARLDVAPTRMSFHLATLERAGLLKAQRDGRHIHYAVNYAQMQSLLGFLIEDCCRNDPAVCCFPAEAPAGLSEPEQGQS